MLWIHGYTLDSGIWAALWDRLPEYTHVGIDLPGHGESAPLRREEGLGVLADRLGRIASGLGARHVVALSFGTIVAIELAARWTDTVRTLVLGAPALGGGPQDPVTQRRYREIIRCHRRSGPGKELRDLWLRRDSNVFRHASRDPSLWALLQSTVARHRWTELRDGSMHRLTAQTQDKALLRRITADTLLLLGEHEMPAFVASAARIRSAVRRSRRAEVPGTGHLCLLEDPDTAAALIGVHLSAAAEGPR
ncbi:alpha/beta hydrolase [Pseudonocardia tropica]